MLIPLALTVVGIILLILLDRVMGRDNGAWVVTLLLGILTFGFTCLAWVQFLGVFSPILFITSIISVAYLGWLLDKGILV